MLAALAASVIVLVVAAASGPLFVSSAQSAALHRTAATECPEATLPALVNPSTYGSSLRTVDPQVRAAIARAGLPTPYLVAQATSTLQTRAGAQKLDLYARPGALDHLRLLTHRRGRGLWIPDTLATSAHLRVGSAMALTDAAGDVRLPVAGIYRDMSSSGNLPRYWCSWAGRILSALEKQRPPFIVTDVPTLQATPFTFEATSYVPIPVRAQSASAARAAQRRVADLPDRLAADGVYGYASSGQLPGALDNAERVGASLLGVSVPIAVAGSLAALLLVAGAGAFWVRRRSRELRILIVRGVGPGALAGQAVLELGPAIVIAAVAGWFATTAIVRGVGPTSLLAPEARRSALITAGLATLLAVATVAVTTLAAARMIERRPLRRRACAWAWEGLVLAAAGVAYVLLRRAGAVTVTAGVVRLNPLAVAFPLLTLAGASLLLARLAAAALRLPTRRSGRRVVLFLAGRRLAGSPLLALGLAIATALPCGIFTYAVALTDSVQTSVRDKYQSYVGADHAFATLSPPGSSIDVGRYGTVVTVIDPNSGSIGGKEVAVLGIDPSTFRQFGYESSDLASDVDRLSAPSAGAVVPAIDVNTSGLHRASEQTVALGDSALRVRIVATEKLFPGLRNGYHPMVVVPRVALRNVDPFINRTEEVWTTDADRTGALSALASADVGVRTEITATSFVGSTGLQPLTWAFGYLRALAVLIGLVALAALVFTVAIRVRRDLVAYVLTRRMGLPAALHRRSVALEVGTVVVTGWASGSGLALAAFAAVYRLLDVNPTYPPPTPFGVPTSTLLVGLAIAVAAVCASAVALQALLDHRNVAEVMRGQ